MSPISSFVQYHAEDPPQHPHRQGRYASCDLQMTWEPAKQNSRISPPDLEKQQEHMEWK